MAFQGPSWPPQGLVGTGGSWWGRRRGEERKGVRPQSSREVVCVSPLIWLSEKASWLLVLEDPIMTNEAPAAAAAAAHRTPSSFPKWIWQRGYLFLEEQKRKPCSTDASRLTAFCAFSR